MFRLGATFPFQRLDVFLVGAVSILIVLFSFSAVQPWHSGYPWHDQQRIYQLVLLLGAMLALPFIALPITNKVLLVVLGIFILGIASSIGAEYPDWAFKEWARYVGLFALCVVVGSLGRNRSIAIPLGGLIALVGLVHVFQFIVSYIAAIVTEIRIFDIGLLYWGFSNPRFFAQFQALLLPVMAGLVLHLRLENRFIYCGVLFGGLLVQWCIAIALGGRGLWLALAVSHIALLVAARKYWPLVMVQGLAAAAGFALYGLLFVIVPQALEVTSNVGSSLRVSLSLREHLWSAALAMAQSSPWLGIGPMHFSATYNSIAAHPHQVVLQWAAEWGLPATIIAVALGVSGVIGAMVVLRRSADVFGASLWLSIAGALTLAQVDGVFVMPYTETWLALLVGLGIARWMPMAQVAWPLRAVAISIAIVASVILMGVLIVEVPVLPEASDAYMDAHATGLRPRFWSQGWIPMLIGE